MKLNDEQVKSDNPHPASSSQLRNLLRSVGLLRNSYYLSLALRDCVFDPWTTADYFQSEYGRAKDPWGYSQPLEQIRFKFALELLDQARGTAKFQRCFEIGCGEGIFTEFLEARCESLVSVDFCILALDRARKRKAWSRQVAFERWDLYHDPCTATYDLISIMEVLTYCSNPVVMRKAVTKLVHALRPSGYLLFTDGRRAGPFEDAWWSRFLLRSGTRIEEFLSKQPCLRRVATHRTETHVISLFCKVLGDSDTRLDRRQQPF
ncbi:MAG: methyltransferase domain-containing protein [Ignavibacteriales bacterium]|nr:methyltransferase domain-containing protein [Ignavibacteriales bacterium]